MNKRKIFNDPVYGFISIPYDIVFDVIEHPYFQRLRRIQQLDERARDPLPQTQQHPGRMGHRRERTVDGFRQHGRNLGNRRSLHA